MDAHIREDECAVENDNTPLLAASDHSNSSNYSSSSNNNTRHFSQQQPFHATSAVTSNSNNNNNNNTSSNSNIFSSCWKFLTSATTIKALLLGQFLSLILTGTGVTSQLLSTDYNVSFPTTQSLLNYVLLFLVYGSIWLYQCKKKGVPSSFSSSSSSSATYCELGLESSGHISSSTHSNSNTNNVTTTTTPLNNNSNQSNGEVSITTTSVNVITENNKNELPLGTLTATCVTTTTDSDSGSNLDTNSRNYYHRSLRPIKEAFVNRWWKYLLLAILDVEANYLVVRAYEYTTITSIQLLDCFSIPCVMALSWFLLKTRYSWLHVCGVAICLSGIVVLFISDMGGNDSTTASDATLGNILCLCGAALYGICNVSQEYLVRNFDRFEFLTMLGLWGTIVSGLQVAIFERDEISSVGSQYQVILLVIGFSLCLFTLYSLVPVLLVLSSATFMNLSFLTSDVYTLFFGLFLFGYTLSWVYFVSFALVVVGLVLYNRYTPPSAEAKEKSRSEASA